MTETGLSVETELPFSCSAGPLSPALLHGSRLLLKVTNLLDQHELEPDKTSERIEAKLDLMLHWLGLQLFGADGGHPAGWVRLGPDTLEWETRDAAPAPGDIVLTLGIHPALAAPLRLAARALEPRDGRARAELVFPDEDFADAWTQWLFRRHRKAVQEARHKSGA